MAVGHRTETLPTVTTQLVESAVVAGTRVGVGSDGFALVQGSLGEVGPRDGGSGMVGRDLGRVSVVEQCRFRLVVAGKQSGLGSEQVTELGHALIVPATPFCHRTASPTVGVMPGTYRSLP